MIFLQAQVSVECWPLTFLLVISLQEEESTVHSVVVVLEGLFPLCNFKM